MANTKSQSRDTGRSGGGPNRKSSEGRAGATRSSQQGKGRKQPPSAVESNEYSGTKRALGRHVPNPHQDVSGGSAQYRRRSN
jgi:hypothetical protein